MALPRTSRLQFLDCAGIPLDTPGEWEPALIELLFPPSDWESISLSLQNSDLPLRLTKVAGQTRILADWPRQNPGHYQLEVCWAEGCEQRFVTITPQKISQEAFEHLLADLESKLPAAIGIALQRLGAFSGITILPPGDSTLSQELLRLRRAILGTDIRPGLASVLEDLSEHPHQVLMPFELWTRANQARRPHPSRLKDAVCRPANRTSSGTLVSVLDTRVEHTFDVYENRLVRVFAHQVEQRLLAILRLLGRKNPGSAAEAEAQILADLLLRARRRAHFLDDVSLPRNLPTQTTMVLLNRPEYRAALQGYLEFRKCAAVRIVEPRLDAPLENVPYLYQLWGTMTVVAVLLKVSDEVGFRILSQQFVHEEPDGLCVHVVPDGAPLLVLEHPASRTLVRLIPERSYSRKGHLQSISFPQRPDVAVEIVSPTLGTTVLLFDPKYKLDSEQSTASQNRDDPGMPLGSPKKTDIDKMHTYRDAIRDTQLQRVVRYAAILYPGPGVRYRDQIEALQAYPGKAEQLCFRMREILLAALS